MRSIAVIKPDHLGDLVLAAPAIRWLESQSSKFTLFVQEPNLPTARYLFPNTLVESIHFGYLAKGGHEAESSLEQALSVVRNKDLVVFLRSDQVLCRERISHLAGPCIFPASRDDRHETANHREGIKPYFGDYDCDRQWIGNRRPFPHAPQTIGLCLGSGFPTNKWSVIRWTELGRRLLRSGKSIRLIGGTQERHELELVANAIGLDASSMVIGGDDIGKFLRSVSETDVVIASDGGSGHLCSLVAPILSISASVPFRRYAPFGIETRVLSVDLPCSPCLNAHESRINICFSHECSYGISPDHVLTALNAPSHRPGTVLLLDERVKLFYAPSHVQ